MNLLEFILCILCVVYGWVIGHLLGRKPDWKAFGLQGVCVALFCLLIYITYKFGGQ